MSPTAVAAKHLMYGDTIHGCLKMNAFENMENKMLHGANATLASDLCQVKYVIIDEISMVGANFFWQINQKLKMAKGSDEYFGGISVIATGDFHQLPPVRNPWIFNRTTFYGRANATVTNLWKTKFKMYKLTKNVRAENDEEYSKLQEDISVGLVSPEMVDVLNSRVEAKCPTEDKNEWYKNGKQIMITSTHEIKERFNAKQLNNLEGNMITFPAIDKPTKRNQILPDFSKIAVKQMRGLATVLNLKKDCPIKITHNINKKDGLVNGTFGYVCETDEEKGIIWCMFSDKVGSITRKNSKEKCEISGAVPIHRIIEHVKLTKNMTSEGNNYNFKRSQFPLVLAYAITSHSAQGITKDIVIIDYGDSRTKHALFSVPFSRAKTLEGVYLKKINNMFSVNRQSFKNMNGWRIQEDINFRKLIYMSLAFLMQLLKRHQVKKSKLHI